MSAKRASIVTTAIKLFNQYGFKSVGIDRIIAESNVAKMTFYKYFASKSELIKECLVQRDNAIRSSIEQALTQHERTPAAQLKGLFDWYQNWFMQPDFFGCMFVKASEEFTDNDEIRTIILGFKTWLTQTIEDILTQGSIANAAIKARQIHLLLDGATVNEHIYQDDSSIELAYQLVKPMIAHRA